MSIRIPRHTETTSHDIVFGSMNVASLSPSKLDELLVVARQQTLDVLLLCETWHDADSVSIRVVCVLTASPSFSAPDRVAMMTLRPSALTTEASSSSLPPTSG